MHGKEDHPKRKIHHIFDRYFLPTHLSARKTTLIDKALGSHIPTSWMSQWNGCSSHGKPCKEVYVFYLHCEYMWSHLEVMFLRILHLDYVLQWSDLCPHAVHLEKLQESTLLKCTNHAMVIWSMNIVQLMFSFLPHNHFFSFNLSNIHIEGLKTIYDQFKILKILSFSPFLSFLG